MEHKFGASCFNSGSVLCRVILDHGGYVSGETILVSAIIRNRSNIHIKSTKASLREVSISDLFSEILTDIRPPDFDIGVRQS